MGPKTYLFDCTNDWLMPSVVVVVAKDESEAYEAIKKANPNDSAEWVEHLPHPIVLQRGDSAVVWSDVTDLSVTKGKKDE